MKITFKKAPHQPFQLRHTDVKYQKKKIGYIKETENGYWEAMMAVKKQPTENDPACFRWVAFTKSFTTEASVREYLLKNQEAVFNMYNIHQFED